MSIDEWRRRIDEIDAQVLALLSERACAAKKIGEQKARSDDNTFVPTREKQIYARLKELNEGPLSDEDVRAVFREVISACRRLEEPISVAFLGPEGTFTHVAAYDIFGHAARYLPGRTISSVFAAVETGRANCGVVPIENSSEGAVRETLDMFVTSELEIMSEEVLQIHLNLLGLDPDAEIQRVCSKPIALAQCRNWLAEHLPNAERIETASTAQAAREAADDANTAVVAHEMVARLYGLEALQSHIEDVERNVTRFLVISPVPPQPTGNDKTSLLCSVKHQPGALWELLNVIKNHDLNMTYLYPRPSRDKPWEYFFFIDLDGHREDAEVAAGLAEAETHCSFFKVLGSFPKAD